MTTARLASLKTGIASIKTLNQGLTSLQQQELADYNALPIGSLGSDATIAIKANADAMLAAYTHIANAIDILNGIPGVAS